MGYHNNPYNFVPLHEDVFRRYESTDELPSHGQIQDELLSGLIRCTIKGETPISISDGNGGFFRNAKGEYVIPGSTLKGLIRQNMQILGFGAMRPGQEFDDSNMLYRLVAPKNNHPKISLKDAYIDALGADNKSAPNFIPEKVKAGYLVQSASDRKYRLYPTKCWRVNRKTTIAYDWRECFAQEHAVYYALVSAEKVQKLCVDGAAAMLPGTLLSPGSAPRSPQSVYVITSETPGRVISVINDVNLQNYQAHYDVLLEKYDPNVPEEAEYLKYWKLPTLEEGQKTDTEPWPVFYYQKKDRSYTFNRIKQNKDAKLGVLVQRASDHKYVLCYIPNFSIQRNNPDVRAWKDIFAKSVLVAYQKIGRDCHIQRMRNHQRVPQGYQQGTLFCPDKELASNPHYLFEACDLSRKDCFTVADGSIANYLSDFESRRNTLKGTERNMTENYWKLPTVQDDPTKDTKPWPVFYREVGGKEGDGVEIDFGRSAYLRVRFDHSLGEGVGEAHKRAAKELTLDYPNAVLGFTWTHPEDKCQDYAYRSRVSFSDFATEARPDETGIFTIPGNPKPTSFADYTVDGKDYNQADFCIRGVKQYWLKKTTFPDLTPDDLKTKKNVIQSLCLIPAGALFTGTIRFHNLYKDELGLLLWCLKLNEGCYQTIGHGKPYGCGRTTIVVDSLELEKPAELYSATSLNGVTAGFEPGNVDELVEDYLNYDRIKDFLKGKRPDETPSVKDFMFIHREIRKPEEVRYMNFTEYRERLQDEILPTIADSRNVAEDAEARRIQEEERQRRQAEAIEQGTMNDWVHMLAARFNSK